MRRITRIVVHCSATPAHMNVTAADIRRWHTAPKPKGNGWRRAGYHRVIKRDGNVSQLEPDHAVANGVRGFNAHSIHICLVGGVDGAGRAAVNFTNRPYNALLAELSRYKERFPHAEIVGHRDLDGAKDCPSFNVVDFGKRKRS